MISRRDFLKNTAVALASLWLPAKLFEPEPVATQSVASGIRTSTMYKAIENKLLMVDELPLGALARYERDVAVKSYVIPYRGMTLEQAVIYEKFPQN